MHINKKDSKLFISSLQRKLDLKRMPTGQEIKFYFTKNVDLINYTNIEDYKNLPIVLGGKKNFKTL